MRFFKISFVVIIGVIMSFSVSAQTQYNLSQKNLTGDVEYYQETSYSTVMKNGEYIKGSRKNSWTKDENIWFNKEGNFEKMQTINSDGSVFQEYIFNYNENILKDISIFKKDKTSGKIVFKYDENGKLQTKYQHYSNGDIECFSTYKYNENGLIIEDITIEEGDILRSKNTYSYNENNKIITWTESFYDIEENLSHTYLYDETDLLIELTSNNYKDEVVEKSTLEYDDSKLIKKTIERGVFTTIIYEYEYDETGNCIKTSEYKGEKLIFIYEYKIDYFE
jgi:hypothetical protein